MNTLDAIPVQNFSAFSGKAQPPRLAFPYRNHVQLVPTGSRVVSVQRTLCVRRVMWGQSESAISLLIERERRRRINKGCRKGRGILLKVQWWIASRREGRKGGSCNLSEQRLLPSILRLLGWPHWATCLRLEQAGHNGT